MGDADQNISRVRRSDWRITLAAALIGLSLGALPHLLGLLLGMANFVITPILVPVLAVASGWWLGRRGVGQSWRTVFVASAFSGVAYVGGILGQFAILARINGSWLQTLPMTEAIKVMIAATAIAAAFISVGCFLSMLRRGPRTTPLRERQPPVKWRPYRGARFASIRCSVRRCMPSRRAVSETLWSQSS